MKSTLAIIMAGGQGARLQPLTLERAKPAVFFCGKYRIIDFVLNNFVNSGIYKIKVLTQFKSDSLNKHLNAGWSLNRILDQYVDPVPAQMRTGNNWYLGTADAVYQNMNLIKDINPINVAVFGGDHVYKMDVGQMLEFHKDKGAFVSIAAIPVPLEQASEYGVIEIDKENRMIGFEEKPKSPKPIPSNPNKALASMGNYIFNRAFLCNELKRDSENQNSSHDFGKDIIPSIYKEYPVYVYDFNTNRIPGETDVSRGYWRDVGNLDSFFEANMDAASISPEFNLYNKEWPLRTAPIFSPPAKFVFAEQNSNRIGAAMDSIVSEGTIVSGSTVKSSILGYNVRINSFSEIDESIIFPEVEVGRHCKLKKVIVDKYASIPEDTTIGYDEEEDRKRFFVSPKGIVIVNQYSKY